LQTQHNSARRTHSQTQQNTNHQQLILRAINSSKSAFLAVTFAARFFESYAVVRAGVVQAGVLLKVLLLVVGGVWGLVWWLFYSGVAGAGRVGVVVCAPPTQPTTTTTTRHP
jgi:hypothetical protein